MTDPASKALEISPKASQIALAGKYANQNAGQFYVELNYFGSNSNMRD